MSAIYAILCLICVLYSTCFVEFFPKSPEILADYAAAQSYRFSHYFICYVSLATILLSGMPIGYQTTKLMAIEFPRSMGEVVVHWNYSMHEFLHKCKRPNDDISLLCCLDVFRQLLSYGYFVAIIGSFSMSSLLHVRKVFKLDIYLSIQGFNFQLTAVLISLAFYAYSENGKHLSYLSSSHIVISVFRSKLSGRFGACIKSRPCPEQCNHPNKKVNKYQFT